MMNTIVVCIEIYFFLIAYKMQFSMKKKEMCKPTIVHCRKRKEKSCRSMHLFILFIHNIHKKREYILHKYSVHQRGSAPISTMT